MTYRSTKCKLQLSTRSRPIYVHKKENKMAEYHLGEIEMKFADIIWENEPELIEAKKQEIAALHVQAGLAIGQKVLSKKK